MAKDYKRYGKTGQFRKPIVGDPTGPIRRQAEQVGESLRKGQIRTDEYGRDYVRGLEKTHSNLLDNFNTNKELTDAIFKTREYATALRGKREVEYLNSIADEFGKKAAYWEDFSTTQFEKYWSAAEYIYDEVEKRKQAKQIKEDETRKDDKDDGITEKNQIITDAAIKEESRLTQEGIRVQRLGDYIATKYTTGLANRKLQPVIANNLADRIIADTGIQNKFETKLQEEKTKENNPLILNSDNVYQLYAENGYRILKETGISETSAAGQKILNHWFELGGKAKNKLYGEEQVKIGKVNVLNAFTAFKNNTNPELHSVRLENLVTTVMSAWEKNDKGEFITNKHKDNRHIDGWIPTFKYLIDNDYYAGEGGEQRLIGDFQHIVWDENGPTGVEFGTKFSKQGTREELLKYLRANTTEKVTSIKDDRKATDNENILKMHQYVKSLTDGLSSKKAEDDFHTKFIQGRSENDAVKIEARKILNYRNDHAPWVTHAALKEAYRQGDLSEFTYHFYTLNSTQKELYKGMFKVLSNMQEDNGGEDVFKSIKEWSEAQVVNILRIDGYVESQARANIDPSSLKYGSTYLRQLQLEAYESLEGKYTGKQRIFESQKLALDEFKKIPIIEANDDGNNTGKRLFGPSTSSAVDDSTLSSEDVLDKLQGTWVEGGKPQMLLPNGKVNPEWQAIYGTETKTGTYKEGPFSQERVNGILKEKNVLSKTSIGNILYTVSIGEDTITIPENIRLIWANSDKSRSQTELLNYALKAQGYTSKDNLIPLTPVDILQKKWPKKIGGISPRHYSKLVPYFLTNDGRLVQQTALQGAE